MYVLFFQKEHFDLLELFLNSEYDPNKTDTAAVSDCERLVETVAKQKFLSTQVRKLSIKRTPPVLNKFYRKSDDNIFCTKYRYFSVELPVVGFMLESPCRGDCNKTHNIRFY